MKCKREIFLACLGAACAVLSACAAAPQTPERELSASNHDAAAAAASGDAHDQERIAHVLDAMGDASTVGHPDLEGLFDGMRAFHKGDYQAALKHFRESARYAGKLSQLTIGLMYLHGRGVDKDPATACAWLALSAERGYPRQEATRARVCGALDREQHARAKAVLARLVPQYGDAAAMPRMRRALQRGMQHSMTGSYLGSTQSVTTIRPNRWKYDCLDLQLKIGGVIVPTAGCGSYDPETWQADKYFAARVPQMHGVVTVGKMQASESTSKKRLNADSGTHAASRDDDN